MSNEPRRAGRHFLQIPGPTPVPERILRAMDMPVIDHRGPEFKKLGLKVLAGIRTIFKTAHPVFIFPSSGTGAWEAALVNALSPGDRVLMYETGHFATLWKSMALKLGLEAEFLASDWRGGVDPAAIDMLHEEGLERVFARHDRHAEGVRRAAAAWGLPVLCTDAKFYSSSLTAIVMPDGHDADAFRATVLEHFDVSLGTGLGKLAGKVFRIGHLGDINDLTILAALAGVEMSLALAGVPHRPAGVRAAMDHFAAIAKQSHA